MFAPWGASHSADFGADSPVGELPRGPDAGLRLAPGARTDVHAPGNASDDVLLLAQLNAAFESGFPNPIDQALRRLPCPDLAAHRKVDEVRYDFIRKRLSVAVERTAPPADACRHTMITKGALRNVLDAERYGDWPLPMRPIVRGRSADLKVRPDALTARCTG